MKDEGLIFKVAELYDIPGVKETLYNMGELGKDVPEGDTWENHKDIYWKLYDLSVKLNGIFESHFSIKDLALKFADGSESIDELLEFQVQSCSIFDNPDFVQSALIIRHLDIKEYIDEEIVEKEMKESSQGGNLIAQGISYLYQISYHRKQSNSFSLEDLLS